MKGPRNRECQQQHVGAALLYDLRHVHTQGKQILVTIMLSGNTHDTAGRLQSSATQCFAVPELQVWTPAAMPRQAAAQPGGWGMSLRQ